MFSLFRLILLSHHLVTLSQTPYDVIFKGLFMGLRFDIVITCYIMAIPLIIETISKYLSYNKKTFIRKFSIAYLYIVYFIAFLISSADIPYFNHFFARFNIMAFQWIDSPNFVFQMIFLDITSYLYLGIFALVYSLFIVIINRISNESLFYKSYIYHPFYLFLIIIIISLFFLGIRGRTSIKSPIKTGTAFFSIYPLINQTSLNPIFTFIRSIIEKESNSHKLNLIDYNVAVQTMKKLYNIEGDTINNNEIGRMDSIRPNVILIIMESMSAGLLNYNGNNDFITPFLDNLIKNNHTIYFANTYSAGIHTYSGVYSSIFGYPTLYKIHPMNKAIITQYKKSFPLILKEKGYYNTYFTTHDDQFDNIGGFLMNNGFDQIISQTDYPNKEILSNLGVPDHYMFDYSLNILNKIKQPFFSVFLTSSNHKPLIIPKNIAFIPAKNDINKNIVAYSDWSLKYFINKAKQQKWYNNTLFVFVADHGMCIGENNYDINLNYNHIPLIFHSDKYIPENIINNNIASQIDIGNTILGFMGVSYTNNCFGKDIFKNNRDFASFVQNDYIASIDNKYLWYYNNEIKREYLFDYKKNSTDNLLTKHPSKRNIMRNYTFAFYQFASKNR
ncbi:MAG: hypothetical protein A2X12_06045 [Bacteroidetes bacterium GWE2_29_8]|nr:MAG: hypothetical protein A2X12_06045 [Bacteroidetes bacterium GWE2_29_8]OFY20058.1 MAG: hypothetical protein A2X02_06745 [Bacteroidetes bacterium GWF2_29_10]